MRPHPRDAETDPESPRGWATCERCGFVLNLYKLRWQLEWRGVQLYNTRHLVCDNGCYDTPQRQLGAVFIPPDPPPLVNARVEQYNADEEPVSTRYTVNGQIRVVFYEPYPIMRIVSCVGNVPSTQLTYTQPNPLDPATLAIIAAFTVQPNSATQTLINNFVVSLKAAGVWQLLDCLFVFAAATSQAALINWKNPGTFNATAVGSPTFTANQGFTGNGSSAYINTNFTPSTAGGNFTQNSAHISARSLTSEAASATNRLIGLSAIPSPSNNRVLILPLNAGNTIDILMNDNAGSSIANTTTQGHFIANRSAASARQVYLNGTSLGSDTNSSSGTPNQQITILLDNGSGAGDFSSMQVASASVGSSLNATQVLALYNAESAYMTAVGAI